MRYNIHLWQLDETGHWTKYAVGRKPDGSVTNERDTKAINPPLALIDSQFGFDIPTPDTARWAISVFNGIVRGHLPTAETRKVVNESGGICIETAMSFLNPTPPIQGGDTIAEGIGGCFISALLSYPRFITSRGAIEIGGIDYLDLWQDNKPLPPFNFTTPEEVIADERRKRGGFDETVAAFCDTVKWIGEATRTSKAARCVIGKVNALVYVFRSLGFADIQSIDKHANEAEEALQAMCDELADRKDAQPTTAQAADGDKFADKVADRLKSMLDPIADNTRGAKNAAERAAAGVDELAAEMTAWREWVRELAKHPNAKPGEPNLCAPVQRKICEIWQGFKNTPADCELPSGAFRKTKRTFAECLALHGNDEVWHGKRLIDFIPDEKAFERVVHNGAEKARQAKAKASTKPPKMQKRKTQARRKK